MESKAYRFGLHDLLDGRFMNMMTLDAPVTVYVDRQVNLTLIESQFNLPDHTQLPDHNGDFVKNFQEHPQSILLTESLWS